MMQAGGEEPDARRMIAIVAYTSSKMPNQWAVGSGQWAVGGGQVVGADLKVGPYCFALLFRDRRSAS